MSKRAYIFAALVAAALIASALLVLPTRRGAEISTRRQLPVSMEASKRPPETEVVRWRHELGRERARIARLETQVHELRARMDEFTVQAQVAPDADPEGGDDSDEETESNEAVTGFDADGIIAAGFPPVEVERFRSRLDEIALEQLYLRDQASREGWLGTPRYREENQELSAALEGTRDEFGDDLYDWMLYTTGHLNRIRVNEVIAGSAASEADIQTGDVVLRYGEERIFNPNQLRDGTAAGEAGELTPVDLLRDGEEVRVYVPRGPLGVRIQAFSQEPPGAR